MTWSDYSSAIFVFRRIRIYLPSRLQKLIEKGLYSNSLTKSQLDSMETLGKKIGLDKGEIYAAVPSSMHPAGFVERRRMTFFVAVISIIIIIIGSFLFLVLTGNYPPPSHTYTLGTRYGSISPNDFK